MAEINYLDFELEIGSGSGREYPVVVLKSPAGEARETMRFPFDELALENHLLKLQNALLRSGGKHRRVLSDEEQTVQNFGRALFDALLVGEVRSRYDVSWREAAQKNVGLRLKLRIQSPELAALPWEFLYDSRQAEFVCLSRSTPVVRYLELPQPIQPLTIVPPLRILGMMVSPYDLPALNVEHEKQRLEEATRDLRSSGLMELTWLAGQTWRDLQKAMRSGPWHVFHFIGHGGFDRNNDEGFMALADEEGKMHRLNATQLGRLLSDHRSLRFVLLNACEGAKGSECDIFSGTATILVRRGLPAVLAMQYEITDRAAIEFSRAFYEALAEGMPVDAAVAEARKSVSFEVTNTVEWGTPVLYMRAPDGRIFDIEPLKKAQERRHETEVATTQTTSSPISSQYDEGSQHATKEPEAAFVPQDMVLVSAGSFLMGDDNGGEDERPEHQVHVDAFYMDKYEVTVAKYQQFLNVTGHSKPDRWDEQLQYPYHPVVFVNWDDAVAYAQWAGKRLPTEAEWEYAARGGYTGVGGKPKYKYPWGDDAYASKANFNADDSREWGWENAKRYLKNVGDYTPNDYGLYDMAGNVWEWCADWYDESYYKNSPSRNPEGPITGTERVSRGGSWGNYPGIVRCAHRGMDIPTHRNFNIGFRCAHDVS